MRLVSEIGFEVLLSTLFGLNGNNPLAAHDIYTSSIQLFNLVAIGCLEWAKHSNVTGLELMGVVGG